MNHLVHVALEVAVGEVLGQSVSAHVLGIDIHVADVDGAALLLLACVVVGKVEAERCTGLRVIAMQPLLSLKRSIGLTNMV